MSRGAHRSTRLTPVPPRVALAHREPARHSPAHRRRPASRWPGLLLVAGATAVAFEVAHLLPKVSASSVAVLLGALLANLGLHQPVLRPGTRFATQRLLRVAVALLGLQLSVRQVASMGSARLAGVLATVAATFAGTLLIGHLLRIPGRRALLVATGFSICGASAVAAMDQVIDGDPEDAPVAVALVTLCGSLAIVLLPVLRGPLGLDPAAFGAWAGASVHDVGQTVATASQVPGALGPAVVVKLTRVVLLAPLVAIVAATRRRTGSRTRPGRRPPVVPMFVLGFLGAIVLASTGLLPAGTLSAARTAQQVLLVAALTGLGTGIRVAGLRTGGRVLLLGTGSWVVVAAVAYLGVQVTHA